MRKFVGFLLMLVGGMFAGYALNELLFSVNKLGSAFATCVGLFLFFVGLRDSRKLQGPRAH